MKRWGALFGVLVAGCSANPNDSAAPVAPDPRARIGSLAELETELRQSRDFSSAQKRELGPDPERIARLHDGRLVGLLGGRNQLVLLSDTLDEIARAPAPDGADALAVAADDSVLVGGSRSNEILRYRAEATALGLSERIRIDSAVGIRALAARGRQIFALDAFEGRVHRVGSNAAPKELAVGRGTIDIRAEPEGLYVLDLFEHSLALDSLAGVHVARRNSLSVTGEPKKRLIRHDGPIWTFDRLERNGERYLALGGVEDHPLDRTIGSFGFVDSFVFVYRQTADGFVRVSETNVAEHGLVTPKVVRWSSDGKLDVWGYASATRLSLSWQGAPEGVPRISSTRSVPGVSAMIALDRTTLAGADPLLDAWVSERAGETRVVPIRDGLSRSVESKVGEALFFTTLMAPRNKSDGALSRFTCETCHFEGATDGRTHHTGRGDVRVTTKPLFGLLENRPYFSRALDKTLAKLVDNEFRAAGAGSGTDPWFSVTTEEFPWLGWLGVERDEVDPLELRRSLMRFISELEHEPNPWTRGRSGFSTLEAQGARLFYERCESCHEARLLTDDPRSLVSFETWEKMIFERGGPIVWASERYEKTDVLPYLNERGTRIPSLRRSYLKARYLTNGSAPDLPSLIDRIGVESGRFSHSKADSEADSEPSAFASDERRALIAFLRLL